MKVYMILIIILFLISCSLPDKFGVPSWTTEFNLKILNDSWHVSELATDDSTLVMIDDVLQFHSFIDDEATMGNFDIEHPGARTTNLVLSEVLPDSLSMLDGEEVSEIFPFELLPVIKQFDEFEEYLEVTFSQGYFLLTIENNTSVYLGNQPDKPLQAKLINYDSGEVFISQAYPQNIAPHSSSTIVVPLGGITIPNTIEVEISGGSSGSNGQSVTIEGNEAILIHLEFSNIKASYAIAKIPNQEIDEVTDFQNVDTNYPHIAGTFQLAGASTMELEWLSPVPVRSVLVIEAVGVETIELVMNDGSYPVVDYMPGDGVTVFTEAECNLNEFLSSMPTRFEYTMYPVIGDNSENYYEIWHYDAVKMRVDFFADVNVEADCWIVPQSEGAPKTSVVQTADFTQEMFDAFVQGGFKFEYTNETGAEAGFDVLISNHDFLTFEEVLQPDLNTVKKLHIPRMTVTEGSLFQTLDIVLNHEDLEPFIADSVFIANRMQFVSNSDSALQNSINLRGEIFLKLLISHELIDSQ